MNTQPELFQSDQKASSQSDSPVVCLGIEFENDTVRRDYFTELLSEKLKDPEFRSIEGFPLGEDEDILNLSDPPYYTACPNPWISDFITEWESEKPEQPEGDEYHREPFAADVSEGKGHKIYQAHSYHTKVPHRAIMRYILHYTQPGDIIYDGFCGTGMTGVAAQMCGDRDEVLSLGYQIESDGSILKEDIDDNGNRVWVSFSKLGERKVVLNDLSPLATFVTSNYNTAINNSAYIKEAEDILSLIESKYEWMYQTKHSNGEIGKVICTVWSDVFVCPECSNEVVYWEAAVNKEKKIIEEEFPCKHCGSLLTKKLMARAWSTLFDQALNEPIKRAKKVPVLIVYTYQGKRLEKEPDDFDFELLAKTEEVRNTYWYPTNRMMYGKETRRNDPAGITHVHHFYTKRNLHVLSAFADESRKSLLSNALHFQLDSLVIRQSNLTRFLASNYFNGGGGWIGTPLSGTLYIPSFSVEVQPFETWSNRTKKTLARVDNNNSNYICSTGSATSTNVISSSIDYIFLDPPFGANINYSELSFLWESWLKIRTNIEKEAIENSAQNKRLSDYRQLMSDCFEEAYRILKPGRWMTVEFSNTKSTVWNAIQTAITGAGFLVANVSALDKKQGSFKAVTTPTAVKQDLVISAYKPDTSFERHLTEDAFTEDGVWDFINSHLSYLPVVKTHSGNLTTIPERDPRILYDQVITYYVRKGYSVPIDSQDFQIGLAQRFSERDGMYFLEEQAAEYDRKKMLNGARAVQQSLFISDEASAIEWLRNLLRDKPQGYQDINPKFMTEISGWDKNEVSLELSTLLEQNFLRYDCKGRLPEQIHSYLSTNWKDMRNLEKDDPQLIAKAKDRWYVPDPAKAGDLEKLREKALLREFDDYIENKKKLKLFRLEAVRAGFKKSWQERDYKTIIDVAEKLPTKVLEEDPKLLMWYDQAITRSEVS